jgi:hypothetical protein
MAMPATAFFALNDQITRLQAEEEAIALITTHSSEPDKRLRELMERIKGVKTGPKAVDYVLNPLADEAKWEQQPGEIAQFRERQKAAAEKIKQDRQAWLEQLKAQKAKEQGTPPTDAS